MTMYNMHRKVVLKLMKAVKLTKDCMSVVRHQQLPLTACMITDVPT